MEPSIQDALESGSRAPLPVPPAAPTAGVTAPHRTASCPFQGLLPGGKPHAAPTLPCHWPLPISPAGGLLPGGAPCNVPVVSVALWSTAGADPAHRGELPAVLPAARGLQRRVYGGEAAARPSRGSEPGPPACLGAVPPLQLLRVVRGPAPSASPPSWRACEKPRVRAHRFTRAPSGVCPLKCEELGEKQTEVKYTWEVLCKRHLPSGDLPQTLACYGPPNPAEERPGSLGVAPGSPTLSPRSVPSVSLKVRAPRRCLGRIGVCATLRLEMPKRIPVPSIFHVCSLTGVWASLAPFKWALLSVPQIFFQSVNEDTQTQVPFESRSTNRLNLKSANRGLRATYGSLVP